MQSSSLLPNKHDKANEKIPRMIVNVIVTQHHTNGHVSIVITSHKPFVLGILWMVLTGLGGFVGGLDGFWLVSMF